MAAHESEGVTVRMGSCAKSELIACFSAKGCRCRLITGRTGPSCHEQASMRDENKGATTRKRWSGRFAGKRQPRLHTLTEFPQLSRHSLWKCVRRHRLRAAPASLQP